MKVNREVTSIKKKYEGENINYKKLLKTFPNTKYKLSQNGWDLGMRSNQDRREVEQPFLIPAKSLKTSQITIRPSDKPIIS